MTQILMVEDEESLSDPLAYLLGREGFDVTVVADGVRAVAEFDRSGADLVLLDLMLPGQSGTEVCKQIRQRSTVPIIMLTAKDAEIDKVLGLELGADDYVTKPYSSRELVARIRAVLRRRAEPEELITATVAAVPGVALALLIPPRLSSILFAVLLILAAAQLTVKALRTPRP